MSDEMSDISDLSSTSSSDNNSNNNDDESSPFRGMSITQILIQETYSPEWQYVKSLLMGEASSSSSNTSRRRKRRQINRERQAGEDRLMRDYFCDNPVYTDYQFRTRFRMRKHLFLRVVGDLENRYTYFQRRRDAIGRSGFYSIQKCTTAMRMLAYGCSADMLDETVRMAKCTILQCLREFVRAIREVYGPTYLRHPNENDISRLLRIGEARGFPDMLGSIDCMYWKWKNCPVAWHGAYTRGDIGSPTIMLEAVASQDLWIWHAFFGVAGSNNDLNVLNQSLLFTQHLQGRAPEVEFQVNGRQYNLGYYLADGIYPTWATFVKTIPLPQIEKEKLFAKHQEGARKDVERAFGVLQSRFAIVRGPSQSWDAPTLSDIMYACIILHKMIVEDERDQYESNYDYEGFDGVERPTMADVNRGAPELLMADILRANANIHNRTTHQQLQHDLLEHIWQRFGGN